jgi:hypothetical protein
MYEMTCQSCRAKVQVQSFLTAAQEPCKQCGQLLMGPLAAGGRTVRPAGFDDPVAGPAWDRGTGGSNATWVGLTVGVLAGVAAVAAVAQLGPAIPLNVRGAVLGALTGVLLAPVFAVCLFVSMLIFPFGLEGILGDSVWTRLARAHNEQRIAPLLIPFLILVVAPMAACAFGGARMTAVTAPMLLSAGLGAMVLGALVGSLAGALLGGRRAH